MKLSPETIQSLEKDFKRGVGIAFYKMDGLIESNSINTSIEVLQELEIAHVALTAAIQIARTIRASENQEYEFGIKPDTEN